MGMAHNMKIKRYEGGIPYEVEVPVPANLGAFMKAAEAAFEKATCEHEHTYEDEDNWGNVYVVCEDCEEEVELEDTRSFYRDENGRVAW